MLTSKKEENGNVGLYYVNQFPGTEHTVTINTCATAQTASSGRGLEKFTIPENAEEFKLMEFPADKTAGVRVDVLNRGRLVSESCVIATYNLGADGVLALHGKIHTTGKNPADPARSETDILNKIPGR